MTRRDTDGVGRLTLRRVVRHTKAQKRLPRRRSRRGFTRVGLPWAFPVVLTALAGCTSTSNGTLPSLASPIQYPSSIEASVVQGPITSPDGPYLYDQQGRVVFLHGVNAVYKRPPYELYPAPGKPW